MVYCTQIKRNNLVKLKMLNSISSICHVYINTDTFINAVHFYTKSKFLVNMLTK